MMLEHIGRAENVFEHRSSLVYDRGKGNGYNHAVHPILLRVLESKSKRAKRFPSSCGNREREEPWFLLSSCNAVGKHSLARPVYRRIRRGLRS